MTDAGQGEPKQQRTSNLGTMAASFVGSVTGMAERNHEKALRTILGTGFAAYIALKLLSMLDGQHREMVKLMVNQHREDIQERVLTRCEQRAGTDTTRAVVFHEKPRSIPPECR